MQAKLWTKRFLGLILSQFLILLLVIRFFGLSYPDEDLLPKTYLLDKNPRIFFAGDSRAEWQLDPNHAAQILQTKTSDIVNIADSSGDPLQVLALIKKHPESFKNAVVIMSISANQLNDGAKDPGYFTEKMISKLSFRQQIELFYPNHLKTLLNYYTHNIETNLEDLFPGAKPDKYFETTNGFRKVQGKFDPSSITDLSNFRMAWYNDFQLGGVKNRLVRDALLEIKPRVRHLFVFAAPFAPSYLEAIKTQNIHDYEINFQATLKKICNSAEIKYIAYLSHPELGDDHFYNIAHLNSEGAKLFTRIILSDFEIAEILNTTDITQR